MLTKVIELLPYDYVYVNMCWLEICVNKQVCPIKLPVTVYWTIILPLIWVILTFFFHFFYARLFNFPAWSSFALCSLCPATYPFTYLFLYIYFPLMLVLYLTPIYNTHLYISFLTTFFSFPRLQFPPSVLLLNCEMNWCVSWVDHPSSCCLPTASLLSSCVAVFLSLPSASACHYYHPSIHPSLYHVCFSLFLAHCIHPMSAPAVSFISPKDRPVKTIQPLVHTQSDSLLCACVCACSAC